MTVPYLTDDCIYNILKYLRHNRPILFNCLLVNRFWCKATVPLLYADPFKDFINKNHASLILTLILCFNKAKILELKNQLKFASIKDVIIINDEYKPLFEYPKYLKNFDYLNINDMIFRWLNVSSISYYPENKKLRENFIPIFHQSIRNDNVKQLNVSLNLFRYKYYENWIQNFTSSLTKLDVLRLGCVTNIVDNKMLRSFLSNIENNCLNLRKLEISLNNIVSNKTIKEKLCSIIQKQNNLRIFELACQGFLSDIFLSLEVQKYSLAYIVFKDVRFDAVFFKSLINLCNLKYLKFSDCEGIFLDQCEVLKYASFKLEGLYFIHNEWFDNLIISRVIKYLGGSLKELILIEPLNTHIIESISICCPNLIILEIKIILDTDLLIFSYFKNLKIRILNIYDDHDDTYEILKELAYNNLSTSIKEVSFHFYKPSKILKLREFLENCHDYLEVINLNYFIELELLEIILNYTERSNNNLQFLGVMKPKKGLNDEELKLLNQIKAKGVKIIYKYRCDDEYDENIYRRLFMF